VSDWGVKLVDEATRYLDESPARRPYGLHLLAMAVEPARYPAPRRARAPGESPVPPPQLDRRRHTTYDAATPPVTSTNAPRPLRA
jgi:hypothetical protein